jgi:hypothetical protein
MIPAIRQQSARDRLAVGSSGAGTDEFMRHKPTRIRLDEQVGTKAAGLSA